MSKLMTLGLITAYLFAGGAALAQSDNAHATGGGASGKAGATEGATSGAAADPAGHQAAPRTGTQPTGSAGPASDKGPGASRFSNGEDTPGSGKSE